MVAKNCSLIESVLVVWVLWWISTWIC